MTARKLVWLLPMFAILFITVVPSGATAVNAASTDVCHFGIGVVYDWTSYDLSTLGVGAYLDWGYYRSTTVPSNITHIRVLKVNDAVYPSLPASLPDLISTRKGQIWVIGNEPDAQVSYQDHLSPETYGDRYYELATIIRANDPTARIGFGPVIQPSPIRITYLTRAINRIIQRAGGDRAKALGLIDIYTIHAFILNEEPLYNSSGQTISWGAGVPVGYDPSWGAPEVIKIDGGVNETYKTHDINIFTQRIVNFRTWMKNMGEQNKPLWITEFGSLFPANESSYLYVSDEEAVAFMEQTFDFALGVKDPALGYPGDENRLVQHLLWYSLNDYRSHFGGSLFDPLTRQRTLVGDHFVNYNPSTTAVPPGSVDTHLLPQATRFLYAGKGSLPDTYNFRILLRVSNAISSDRLTGVKVDLYEGARLVGSQQGNLPRCSGQGVFTYMEYNQSPGDTHTYRVVITLLPGNGVEINPGDQEVTLPPIVVPTMHFTYLPDIAR